MEVQREGRMAVGGRVAAARDLLVFQVAVLGNLIEVEVQPPADYAAHRYVGRGYGHVYRILHPVTKEVTQAGAHPADGPEVTHDPASTPLPTHVAADHGVILEAARSDCRRLRSRGRSNRWRGGPYFYGAYVYLDRRVLVAPAIAPANPTGAMTAEPPEPGSPVHHPPLLPIGGSPLSAASPGSAAT